MYGVGRLDDVAFVGDVHGLAFLWVSCLVLLLLCRTAFCRLSNDGQWRIAQRIDRRRRLQTTRPEVDR